MAIKLDRMGAVANWLDSKPSGEKYDRHNSVQQGAIPHLATELKRRFAKWRLSCANIRKVLSNYNAWSGNQQGEPISSWADLSKLMPDAIAESSNRLKELKLAMVVVRSPLVLGTVNTTITGVEKLMMAVRLSRGASLSDTDYRRHMLEANQGSRADKTYLPWTQNTNISAALQDSDAGFTIRMALLHDLMEFSRSFFKSPAVTRVMGLPQLNQSETVTVADGVFETRNQKSEARSIQYAKSLHCPVECGPSYTTARLLRLPDVLSQATQSENPGPPDPMERMKGVRVTPHPPGYLYLTRDQKTHIAWGIFAWWTLNFPKRWGNGAHCFFAVSDAARSCGAPIVDSPGAYPSLERLAGKLDVRWTKADEARFRQRRDAMIAGTEQGEA